MAPGNDAAVIAAIARLEEAMSGLRDIVVEMREDSKEKRAETTHYMEMLNAKFDGLAARVTASEGADVKTERAIDYLSAEVEDLRRQFAAFKPHLDDLKSAHDERQQRKNVFVLPAIVTAIGSIVLVFGEAAWAFINSRFLHWGG